MTPAEARRCGLRLADALNSMAAEMVRPDRCEAIVRADTAAAVEFCDYLRDCAARGIGGPHPLGCGASAMRDALRARAPLPRPDTLLECADAWRAWGA